MLARKHNFIDALYIVKADVKAYKARKRAKRNKILLMLFCIGCVVGLTMILHAFSVWHNGYDGIGGEAMIPVIALLAYGVYKQIQRDAKNRQSWRTYWIDQIYSANKLANTSRSWAEKWNRLYMEDFEEYKRMLKSR